VEPTAGSQAHNCRCSAHLKTGAVFEVGTSSGKLPLRPILSALLCLFCAGYAVAEPAGHWQDADAPAAAWADAASREVEAYGRSQRPTAVMIVEGDRVIARWGDVGRRVNVHSVRKSLLSALYGIAIAEGRISLFSTLAQLGIDDKPPSLTQAEKQATVRDLLMARSGIYHPAAYETADIRRKRPARGSLRPGLSGSTTIGTSTPSVRSIGRQPGRTSFKALRGESQSQSTWRIFPHATASTFLSHRPSIRPIRS
jgi:CubicO group peptidase (beta-lactamase class C family)